jgi:hypothetical protein
MYTFDFIRVEEYRSFASIESGHLFHEGPEGPGETFDFLEPECSQLTVRTVFTFRVRKNVEPGRHLSVIHRPGFALWQIAIV